MKSVCIVLRNKKDSVKNIDYIPITDSFLRGGYFFDRIILLAYEDVEALHEAVRPALEQDDLCCVIADPVLYEGVRNNLERTFSLAFDGTVFTNEKCAMVLLPTGTESVEIVNRDVVPFLNERLHISYDRMFVRFVGAPGEKVKTALDRAYEISGDALNYNFYEDCGDMKLEIIYDSSTPKMMADSVMRVILEELNEYVYALDDINLENRVYEGLILRKLKLSIAESFTGGRIAARMVKVPGVSAVYTEELNTYSNESKMRRLGVKEDTLKRYGAVSAETAHEMAEGLFAQSGCDICVATTGIAGPQSEGKKPIGLCYISAGLNGHIYVDEHQIDGNREKITQTAVNYALFAVFKLLQQ